MTLFNKASRHQRWYLQKMARQLLAKTEMLLNNVSDECLEEADIQSKLKLTIPVLSSMSYLKISRVSTVHNNYLHLMYQLKKEEYMVRYGAVTEKRLYHATSEFNVDSIITGNLDWRRVARNKFGTGVSFSNDPDYANYHSNSANGSRRAFIVADVLVSRQCTGNASMRVPVTGTDTAIGNKHVYVKFSDHEFLPKYVIFYEAPDRSKSKHFRIHRRRRFY